MEALTRDKSSDIYRKLPELLDRFSVDNDILIREGALSIFRPRELGQTNHLWDLKPTLGGLNAFENKPSVALYGPLVSALSAYETVPVTDAQDEFVNFRTNQIGREMAGVAGIAASISVDLISERMSLPLVSYEEILEMRHRLRNDLIAFREEISELAINMRDGSEGIDLIRRRATRATKNLKTQVNTISRRFIQDVTQILFVALSAAYTQGISPLTVVSATTAAALKAYRAKEDILAAWKNP